MRIHPQKFCTLENFPLYVRYVTINLYYVNNRDINIPKSENKPETKTYKSCTRLFFLPQTKQRIVWSHNITIDCKLCSIAFAVAIASGLNPTKKFNNDSSLDHQFH